MKRAPTWLLGPLLTLLAACGPEAGGSKGADWQSGGSGTNAVSGTEIERYFPLVSGNIYHFRTESFGDGPVAESGMLMMKVHRSSAAEGELRKPTSTQRFRYAPNGVATETKQGSPAFVLKWPLATDQSWLGPHGGKTTITATDARIVSETGTFEGCVTTVETRGGDAPIRISTTFCPEVGIAALEVAAGARVERATLVYYGPPVDIGNEGMRRIE